MKYDIKVLVIVQTKSVFCLEKYTDSYFLSALTFCFLILNLIVDFYTRGAVVMGGFPTNTFKFYNG